MARRVDTVGLREGGRERGERESEGEGGEHVRVHLKCIHIYLYKCSVYYKLRLWTTTVLGC